MLKRIFYNPVVGAIADWTAVLGLIGILLAMPATILAKLNPEWFGAMTWPQALLAGFAGSLVVILVLSLALALCGWGYRTLRPLPPQEVPTQTTAFETQRNTAQDADISHLKSTTSKISDNLEVITEKISNHEIVVNYIVSGWQADQYKILSDEVHNLFAEYEKKDEQMRTIQENVNRGMMLPQFPPSPDHRKLVERFSALGIKPHDIYDAIKRRTEEINTKTEYILLNEMDKSRFSDGAQKKAYYLSRAPAHVMQDFLGSYLGRRELLPKTSEEYVLTKLNTEPQDGK